MTTQPEHYHAMVRAICPDCGQLCDAARVFRGQRVVLKKHCPRCGVSEALVSSDRDWFVSSLRYTRPGSIPLSYSTRVEKGCPEDCGLCPDHEQHTCLPIIEITDHCDMSCPICLVDNRASWRMDRQTFVDVLAGLIAREGRIDTVNISGGEPFTHPELLELVKLAVDTPEIGRVSISTNGRRLAAEPALCARLAELGAYVNLQYDCLDAAALLALRGPQHPSGAGDHRQVRVSALENLAGAGVRTTLIATVAAGVNEQYLGDALRALFEHDELLSLMVQPAAYTGSGRSFAHDPQQLLTIPAVIEALVATSDGVLAASDFVPLPCSHPSCFALCYLLGTDQGYVPFPRFVDLDQYAELLQNRGTIQADAALERTMRGAIDALWSGEDQLPDSEKILRSLKHALRVMYPEDRVLAFEERLHLGEGLVKTIFIHAFMDRHNFELERVKRCCTHYALPDGRLVPACVHNNFSRGQPAPVEHSGE